jgi:3-deoxy-manno-octulosonate cytidylyltransferase (CMP-KDO synthetase)
MTESRPVITVVIPARMASSRYPGKPLVEIAGLPMIEHVRRRALLAEGVDHVVVATCDAAIQREIEARGGRAVMTKNTHERCTDRVQEAMLTLPGDIVAIVQGDEPLLTPAAVNQVTHPLVGNPSLQCVNLLSSLVSEADYGNADIVKAVCDQQGNVIYLTRAPVPHSRGLGPVPVYRQTGIMSFRASFLQTYSTIPETPLERAESVDMLRVLEVGERLLGVAVDYPMLGVDRPADVDQIERILREDPDQRALLERILKMQGAS